MRTFSRPLAILACLGLLLCGLAGCGGKAETMTVVFPKIGSADAAILMTEDATILIDTGETGDAEDVLEVLEQYGRDTVDLLILSHYDKDHVGGAAEILETVTVKRVIGSTSPKNSDEMEAYLAALEASGLTEEILSQPTSISIGGMTLLIDPPESSKYGDDQSNNSSNLVTLTFGDTALLFAGDAMDERLEEETWQAEQYDLIKIPHHGRDADNLAYYLPSFRSGAAAIITSSKKEPESDELVEALQDAGVSVYLTVNGTVTVTSDGHKLSIKQA